VSPDLRDLLEWLERSPRSYDDTMEAWGSHCPRFTTWEDALAAGLIRVVQTQVRLTENGRAALRTNSTH
jgi:hypothetical protein